MTASNSQKQSKEFVEGEFRKGKAPYIVVRENPDIPRSSIYHWYKSGDWKESEYSPAKLQPIPTPHPHFTRLDPQAKFDKLEDILWEHATSPNDTTSVVVQACQCLLKVFKARDEVKTDAATLSDAERVARINEILIAARNRRNGQSSDPRDE